MAAEETDLYYDPYDFEIDTDPYPVWRRLQDEAPLYYNEKYDFYALSRFSDVEEALKDWERLSSARGSVLELIRNGVEMPPGSILFEDPPSHDLHLSIRRQRQMCIRDSSRRSRRRGRGWPRRKPISTTTPTISRSIRIPIRSGAGFRTCLLYTSPSPRDATLSRMPSSA